MAGGERQIAQTCQAVTNLLTEMRLHQVTTRIPIQLVSRSFGWAGTVTLLMICCLNGQMQLIADDQPPQKDSIKQVKPFALAQQNLNPNAVEPPPWWDTSVVMVALFVLVPLLVIILLLLRKQVREGNRSREILQIANKPVRLVSDNYLAVVSPHCNATPDEKKTIAAALRAWLSLPYAKQAHGLEQLEAGEHPHIPAPHVMKVMKLVPPEKLNRSDPADCYWPVALLEVNEGTDLDMAHEELQADLESIIGLLGFTADPSSYDACRM